MRKRFYEQAFIEKTKPILGVSSGREAKITTQKSPSNPPLKSILKKENAKDELLEFIDAKELERQEQERREKRRKLLEEAEQKRLLEQKKKKVEPSESLIKKIVKEDPPQLQSAVPNEDSDDSDDMFADDSDKPSKDNSAADVSAQVCPSYHAILIKCISIYL